MQLTKKTIFCIIQSKEKGKRVNTLDTGNFDFILNNHFTVRHVTAGEGYDTPTDFHCNKGLRKWSRFFYLEKGKIDVKNAKGKLLSIKDGDVIYLPYDVEYSSSWTDSDGGHYYSVEFILEYPDSQNLNLYDDITYLFSDGGAFKKLFVEMKDTVFNGTLGFHLKCQEELMHLLYAMAMHLKGLDSAFRDILPAISVIENDFCGEIDTDELASMCHMSPATFRRRFLAYASLSPVKYRNKLRLMKARELIQTGIYKIGEVARIVGIGDIYYFSKLYKKQFGKAPTDELP